MRWTRPLALLLFALGGTARAVPPGTLVITDHAMDPTSKTFEKDVQKAKTPSVGKSGEGWKVYFVAWLKRAAGAPEVNIVFYEAGAKHEQVNAFPIQTQASAKILLSEVEINPENGFKPGKKYNVLITRLVGGKEDVYARATLELK